MNDLYLAKYSELILECFDLPIHPMICIMPDEHFNVKVALRKHMFEYNQRGEDRVEDITKKMLDVVAMEARLSTYYLTLNCFAEITNEQQEEAFSACNKTFASMKAMLTEYRNQVFRRIGYA